MTFPEISIYLPKNRNWLPIYGENILLNTKYFNNELSINSSPGKTNNNMNTWTLLAQTLLNLVAEGAKLGEFLAKFNLSEETLDNLLCLDNKLKPAWNLIKVSSNSKKLKLVFSILLMLKLSGAVHSKPKLKIFFY